MVKAPFPYFGGKSMVADIVWQRLGDVKQYIEPFFGSGAVLLRRPPTHHTLNYEIVNDADGFVANAWRSLQHDPNAVAKYCDWPCNHADLAARRYACIAADDGLITKLIQDPDYHDPKIAGYWIYVLSHWIGGGAMTPPKSNQGIGKIPHITCNQGIGKIPHITCNQGKSEQRHVQEPYCDHLYDWFRELSERLRYVKVVCGDWNQVCGGNWQTRNKPCGMFFDPPYSADNRADCYHKECYNVANDVRQWCIKRGDNKDLRIVLAGYYEEHESLLKHGWTVERWSAQGGYGGTETRGSVNRHREALFFSPHCLSLEKEDLLW